MKCFIVIFASLLLMQNICGENYNYHVNETISQNSNIKEPQYREVEVFTSAFTIYDNYTPSTVMANGEQPYVGCVAYNNVPIGTIIIIDDIEYVVKDRALHDDVVDIYMNTVSECMEYGVKYKTIKIKEEVK